jgi:hypothetical protein
VISALAILDEQLVIFLGTALVVPEGLLEGLAQDGAAG